MRRKNYSWLRHPKTTAERKANQDGWCRGKRRPCNLANAYDDWPTTVTKSWKDKRKTQHYPGGRGKHHLLKIYKQKDVWKLEEYCRDHNIPCRTDEVKKSYLVPEYKWFYTGKVTKFYFRKNSYWYIHERFRRKTGRMVPRTYTDYYIFNWWHDKDIGINYILNMEG